MVFTVVAAGCGAPGESATDGANADLASPTASSAHGWPVAVRYEVASRPHQSGAESENLHEFAGYSWMRWTDVVLDGTDRPGAAGSNSTLSVKHFEKGQYRAGLVQSSDLIQEGDVFGTARSVARSFPEGVSVQIDDRHLESSPAGQDHSSPEPAPVGPTHVPMREVGPDELGSEQMAPSEIFNPGFGRPWDGPDSPYRPLDESEVEDLFDST